MSQRRDMCCFFIQETWSQMNNPPPPKKTKTEKIIMQFTYAFLYGVSLTDCSFCSRNAAGDATVALTHAPQFAADFLRV